MEGSRTKNTARNALFGLANHIITLILSFVSRTIFIRVLGVEYLGISGLFSDVLMMLSMADLGFGTAMAYSFYKPIAEGDHDKIAALVGFYRKIYHFIALGVALLGIALIPFLPYIVNLERSIPYLQIYYLFFLANTVVSYLFVYKTSIINADQKNYLLSKYQMLISLVKTVLQSGLLLITKNFLIYLSIQVLFTIVNNLVVSKKADSLYPFIKTSAYQLDQADKKSIFTNMKSIFLYKISGVLLNGTTNTFISVMVGTVWVGFFSNYNLVINTLNGFINILYASATASIGNVIIREQPRKRFEIFQTMQTISLIITTFSTVCLFLLLPDLILVWLGSRFVLESAVFFAILLNFYIAGVVHPIWSFREATGLYVQTKYIMLIAAVVNILLSLILGRLFGMAGILLAPAIARFTTYFWYEPNLLFQQYFQEKVRHFYVPLIKSSLFTILLCLLFTKASSYFPIDSWAQFIVKSLIVASFAFMFTILAYHGSAGFKTLRDMAGKLIHRSVA